MVQHKKAKVLKATTPKKWYFSPQQAIVLRKFCLGCAFLPVLHQVSLVRKTTLTELANIGLGFQV